MASMSLSTIRSGASMEARKKPRGSLGGIVRKGVFLPVGVLLSGMYSEVAICSQKRQIEQNSREDKRRQARGAGTQALSCVPVTSVWGLKSLQLLPLKAGIITVPYR